MIVRVYDEKRADKCDTLLTRLIQDERQYDDSIDLKFVVKDYFKNVIKDINNILLCYEENSILMGYIFLKPIVNDNKKGYIIDGLYVESEYRNKGIATKLIKEGISLIDDALFVDINVMANNMKALKLYKSLGFNEFKITLRKDL